MGQTIRNYQDINENLRFWFDRFFDHLDSPVFYDIGANDGVFTVAYAPRCRMVYAFEPARVAADRLQARIDERGLANVSLFRVALSDEPGSLLLHGYSDDTFNTLFRRTELELSHYSLEETDSEEISVFRLDDLADREDLPAPDLVKMDIEGAELRALLGGKRTIRSAMPVIISEYSVDNTANAGYARGEIADLLESWGYIVRGLYRNIDTILYAGEEREKRSVWNLLCVPETRAHMIE